MLLGTVSAWRYGGFKPLGLAGFGKQALCQLGRWCQSALGLYLGGSVGGIAKPASLGACGHLIPVVSLCGLGLGGALGSGGCAKPQSSPSRLRLLCWLGGLPSIWLSWFFGLFGPAGWRLPVGAFWVAGFVCPTPLSGLTWQSS
jgi:hypothetical protein